MSDRGEAPAPAVGDLPTLVGIAPPLAYLLTRIYIALALLDLDVSDNRPRNLVGLCQRCRMIHDWAEHRRRCWVLAFRLRAIGDLFNSWPMRLTASFCPYYRKPAAMMDDPIPKVPRDLAAVALILMEAALSLLDLDGRATSITAARLQGVIDTLNKEGTASPSPAADEDRPPL